ncbi:MAG: hypothetical protein A3K61_07005 [Thaumarchaeota archaeon RBG_16_49_8]|nr:MAG: hypothetical protein A3K61_07005 [Thaumarchaeota archaeon RBG_16_49_8]
MVDAENILKTLPGSSAAPLQKGLVDTILKSKNAQSLPADVAKRLLTLYHDNQLGSTEGLVTLLQASVLIEQEKTAEMLQELGLTDAAAKVRSGQ